MTISSNTILYCKNWKECVSFYRNVMKFDINLQKDWFIEFHIINNYFISVADENRSSIKSGSGKGITLSFKVSSLYNTFKKFNGEGINCEIKTHPWGGKYFFINDPEGNRIGIWSD
jgi:predicted enzyme related to lactoylglutathione lyase